LELQEIWLAWQAAASTLTLVVLPIATLAVVEGVLEGVMLSGTEMSAVVRAELVAAGWRGTFLMSTLSAGMRAAASSPSETCTGSFAEEPKAAKARRQTSSIVETTKDGTNKACRPVVWSLSRS